MSKKCEENSVYIAEWTFRAPYSMVEFPLDGTRAPPKQIPPSAAHNTNDEVKLSPAL